MMPEQTETGITVAAKTLDRESAKIDVLGLSELAALLYVGGFPITKITEQLNERLVELKSEETLTYSCVYRWLKTRPEAWLEEIKKLRQELLVSKIEEWEDRALDVRQEAMDDLDSLIQEQLDTGIITALTKGGVEYKRELTMNEKKDLANIIMKKITIQESGESMSGIGAEKGKRLGVNVNVQVDIVGQLRKNRSKKAPQDTEEDPIDVPYEDVTE